jgi:hypothetical protein
MRLPWDGCANGAILFAVPQTLLYDAFPRKRYRSGWNANILRIFGTAVGANFFQGPDKYRPLELRRKAMALSASRQETSALREFLNSSKGKALSIGAVLLMLGVAGFLIFRSVGPSEGAALSRDRMFIDAKTGKGFNYELKGDDEVPVTAPSGGKTGYPAELCYWTKDGKPKTDPTPVLLKRWLGDSGPTFCPDCGRLVVGHNPAPGPGVKPPPTQAEYKAPRGGR